MRHAGVMSTFLQQQKQINIHMHIAHIPMYICRYISIKYIQISAATVWKHHGLYRG